MIDILHVDSLSNLSNVCVLLTEGTSLYEYTLILYVLNSKLFITISVSVVDNTFLLPIESIYTMTYPLACSDIVQLTLILVSLSIYALMLSGGPLGARQLYKIS